MNSVFKIDDIFNFKVQNNLLPRKHKTQTVKENKRYNLPVWNLRTPGFSRPEASGETPARNGTGACYSILRGHLPVPQVTDGLCKMAKQLPRRERHFQRQDDSHEEEQRLTLAEGWPLPVVVGTRMPDPRVTSYTATPWVQLSRDEV